jgi:hypothetical protein
MSYRLEGDIAVAVLVVPYLIISFIPCVKVATSAYPFVQDSTSSRL